LRALIQREVIRHTQTWLRHIEANPPGGAISGIDRAVASAINSRPFMAAMMRCDRRILFDVVMETIANMLDRMLTPDDGGTARRVKQSFGSWQQTPNSSAIQKHSHQ
jgi:hypothetical protein